MCDDIKKTNGYNKEERRKYPRVKNFIDVYFKVNATKQSTEEKRVDSKNTSLEGICLMVNTPIKVNTILDLRFKLFKDEPELKIKGKIIWINSFKIGSDKIMHYEIGIKFIEISESDKNIISKIYLVT